MAGDIVAFLRARLDEDETNSRYALAQWPGTHFTIDPGSLIIVEFHRRHDPARVLREVAAKRAILARHRPAWNDYVDGDGIERATYECDECRPPGTSDNWPCATVRALGAVYGGHPDYWAEWAL